VELSADFGGFLFSVLSGPVFVAMAVTGVIALILTIPPIFKDLFERNSSD
jgi:hypothetical protein